MSTSIIKWISTKVSKIITVGTVFGMATCQLLVGLLGGRCRDPLLLIDRLSKDLQNSKSAPWVGRRRLLWRLSQWSFLARVNKSEICSSSSLPALSSAIYTSLWISWRMKDPLFFRIANHSIWDVKWLSTAQTMTRPIAQATFWPDLALLST